MIDISYETVEEMVRLADYLALSNVLEICEKFMIENLNDSNCLQFKFLSDFYSLGNLSKSVRDYILPRMSMLVRRSDTVDLPVDVVRHWLSDNQTNYAREADILKLIQDMVASRTEFGQQMEREKARDLLHYVEFEYLPPEVIERQVLSNPDTLDWLSARPELLERVRDMVGRNQVRGQEDNIVEAIICRRQAPGTEEDLQVMLYLIKDDAWRVLRQPRYKTRSGTLWSGLESMVMHDGSLYTLCSRMEDVVSGCILHTPRMMKEGETKSFNRLYLQTGAWSVLPSPGLVTGPTVLVSTADRRRLLAIDRSGVVERYLTSARRWTVDCCAGFRGSSKDKFRLLPMIAKDGACELYVLRSFFPGCSFISPKRWLSINRLDADPMTSSGRDDTPGRHSWNELWKRDIEDLFNADDDVNFFGYSISPTGLISLKDVLGHTRAEFDTTKVKWTTLPRTTVPCPSGFIRHIYGSIDCSAFSSSSTFSSSSAFSSSSSSSTSSSSFSSRVCLAAASPIDNYIFVMFDSARGRFKMTRAPPYPISGLLCHVTLPKASVELMCRQD